MHATGNARIRCQSKPQDLGVAVLELVIELAERRDLGRAHEREVFRPKEHHPPLASVFVTGDSGEVVAGLLGVDLGQVTADESGELVGGELIANG